MSNRPLRMTVYDSPFPLNNGGKVTTDLRLHKATALGNRIYCADFSALFLRVLCD